MTSVKVIFRASSPTGKEGALYFRIIHKRKVRQLHTGSRIARDEWDEKGCNVIQAGTPSRLDYLISVQKKLDENTKRLEQIIDCLDNSGREYSVDEIVEQYLISPTVAGFISFTRKLIAESRMMGKTSAAEHYSTALNSFIRFHGNEDIPFDNFDSSLMIGYESYLKELNITPNTISFYMRKLRAVYNRAVEREITPQRNPFKHVYTGVAKTRKRALSLNIIRSLRNMDLRLDPLSELARDMFLFSFYTRGMSMVDMSYLLKINLHDGILTYRRKKTAQQLCIRWEDKMQEIVKRHDIPESDYLLPLIKPCDKDSRRQYQNASHMINRRLKKLGIRLGMTEPLTMYCARHTWASIAHDNNVPISVISQGMGHDSEKTTRIYLASLNTSVIDQANNDIINLLDN